MSDDDLTAAYLAGYREGNYEVKRLKRWNADLLELVDYALVVSDEGLPLGEQWRNTARAAITRARGNQDE